MIPTDTERLDWLVEHDANLTQDESWKGRFSITVPSSDELPFGGSFFADDLREVIDKAMRAVGQVESQVR